MTDLFIIFLLALTGSVLFIFLLISPARMMGYVDPPEKHDAGRKKHAKAVPPIGGVVVIPLAIFLSWMAGFDWLSHWPVLAAIMLMLITGVVDDKYHISPTLKLALQIVAAYLIVIPGGAVLTQFGNLLGFGPIDFGIFAGPFSIFCVVLFINAINMIDGLDGLSGGVVFIILSSILLLMIIGGGSSELAPLCITVIGALIGFWLLNMRFPWQNSARVFMGDGGTLALGAFIAWLAITVYNNGGGAIPSMSLGWLLAFPVMDAFALFTLRLSQKRSPFSPDRLHFHHILLDTGFRTSTAVGIIYLINIAYSGIALVALNFHQMPEAAFFYPWFFILALHTLFVFKSGQAKNALPD